MSRTPTGGPVELPKIISVDDHVVEPAHVWQTWLPEKYREKGPRVERKRWGAFRSKKGAKYEMTEDPDGEWGDAWIYEDKVIYVQKKFVAIPKSATSGDDVSTFDKTVMTMTATTYDDMRPGCWDAKERKKDFEINWVDGSLPFPTFPRFCGQTFKEADDMELALACVRGLQRLDGRGVVRSLDRDQHPALHHPALGRRARGQGDPAQRRARRARGVLLGAADPARPPEHPHRLLGPDVRGQRRHRHHGVHARRARRRPTRSRRRTRPRVWAAWSASTTRWRRWATTCSAGSCTGSRSSRSRTPKARSVGCRTRSSAPTRCGRSTTPGRTPSACAPSRRRATTTTACSVASPGTGTACGRSTRSARTTSASRPTTRTPTRRGRTRRTYCEKMLEGFTDEQKYKILRGNAIRMLELDRV